MKEDAISRVVLIQRIQAILVIANGSQIDTAHARALKD